MSEFNDDKIRTILNSSKNIAVVGHSDKPNRVSYQIAQFLKSRGCIVYPVNPKISTIDGQPCYPSLAEVPAAIDLVNVFRRSEYLLDIVDEAIAVRAKTFWAQLGIFDPIAERKALNAGLNFIMDACIKVEYLRLLP